jgi:hypothetical protein
VSETCLTGTYATDLLSPDGCKPCPRGTYASSGNLISASQCKLCPPGTYSDRTGVTSEAGCTLCPPNTWGAQPGLKTHDCSGKCKEGTYSNDYGNTLQSSCIDCPPGYAGGGGQCTPNSIKRRLAAQGESELERSKSPEYDRLLDEFDAIAASFG